MTTAHHCPALLVLDFCAATGDPLAGALARFHEQHPAGPQTAEEYAEHATLARALDRVA